MAWQCRECGYDLSGLGVVPDLICPECGVRHEPRPFEGRSEREAVVRGVLYGLIPVILVLAMVPLTSGWTRIAICFFGTFGAAIVGAGVCVGVYQSRLAKDSILNAEIGSCTVCFLSFCVNLVLSAAALVVLLLVC